MARADLLSDLIKYGLEKDTDNLKKIVDAICAEERAKQHHVLADKLESLKKNTISKVNNENSNKSFISTNINQSFVSEKIPQKKIDNLILSQDVFLGCKEMIEEQLRADLLRSYGLEPRNKILLIGPPGNGKTSLAEAIAESLSLPFYTVKYESIIGSYLGETSSKLAKLIEFVKTRRCVLFFDEFETLGKERADIHETGEIKRLVSSLLLHIDSLPSYVIIVGATNHEKLLDKAAWRRFQIKLNLTYPTKNQLIDWFALFEKKNKFNFGVSFEILSEKTKGLSYAEVEEFGLSIFRQFILGLPLKNAEKITKNALKRLKIVQNK